MLNDYNNRKKVEIPYLWKTLAIISRFNKKKIDYSKKIYNRVLIKIKKMQNWVKKKINNIFKKNFDYDPFIVAEISWLTIIKKFKM